MVHDDHPKIPFVLGNLIGLSDLHLDIQKSQKNGVYVKHNLEETQAIYPVLPNLCPERKGDQVTHVSNELEFGYSDICHLSIQHSCVVFVDKARVEQVNGHD